jgi:hypothetical protein
MEVGDEGAPRQASVAAALQLLNLALDLDQAVAADINALLNKEQHQPLERQLIKSERLHTLMQYVHFSLSAEIQLQVWLKARKE